MTEWRGGVVCGDFIQLKISVSGSLIKASYWVNSGASNPRKAKSAKRPSSKSISCKPRRLDWMDRRLIRVSWVSDDCHF